MSEPRKSTESGSKPTEGTQPNAGGQLNPAHPPPPPPPQRGGGVINKFKAPQVGVRDIIGNKLLLKWLLAEFLGTFFLVFCGIGSVFTSAGCGREFFWDSENQRKTGDPDKGVGYCFVGRPTPLHIAFGFGMAVACIAQAIGHISGAHLNPAVSFGLVVAGECSILKAFIYSLIQSVGAITGAGVLKLCTWFCIGDEQLPSEYLPAKYDPEKHTYGWPLGVNLLSPGINFIQGILIECLLTMVLVLTILGVTDSLRKDIKGSASLAIGFAVFLVHVVGINLTGASVNPARSIGPVLFVSKRVAPNKDNDLIVGPILGGVLAGLLYNVFFRASSEEQTPQVSPAGMMKP